MDLLTHSEERADQFTGHLRFDIAFLARRVIAVVDEMRGQLALPLGLFGASTGVAAALVVAAAREEHIRAIVSRGGRPDLAGDALAGVRAPTLLIVGGEDHEVIGLNRKAMARMRRLRRASRSFLARRISFTSLVHWKRWRILPRIGLRRIWWSACRRTRAAKGGLHETT